MYIYLTLKVEVSISQTKKSKDIQDWCPAIETFTLLDTFGSSQRRKTFLSLTTSASLLFNLSIKFYFT